MLTSSVRRVGRLELGMFSRYLSRQDGHYAELIRIYVFTFMLVVHHAHYECVYCHLLYEVDVQTNKYSNVMSDIKCTE